MSVLRDERSEKDPRFSKKVVDSFDQTGWERTLESLERVYGLDPDWTELYTQYIRGDLYAREVVSQATRETCACAALATLDKQVQLAGHLRNGVALGASKEQLLEAILQSVAYAGFPSTLVSLKTYAEVFPEMVKKDRPAQPATPGGLPAGPCYDKAIETASHLYGEQPARAGIDRFNRWDADFGMAVQRFTYGGLYARTVVDVTVRQMIAVACCTVKNALPQLEVHARAGLRVGCTREEIKEVIFQMSAYAGFPYVLQALGAFDKVLEAWDAADGNAR